jgi:hypothetical protein
MRRHEPGAKRRSSSLGTALLDSKELPSGARRVLERVFWGVGASSAHVAPVVSLPSSPTHSIRTTGGLD